ncbi:MAG: AraC family transcriptional regulator [Kiritimatiellia bacterium]
MIESVDIVTEDYYVDTPERRTLNLEPEGLPCIPVLGFSHYQKLRKSTVEHIHPGCLEVSFCLRGSLVFESDGRTYQFMPGNVFISQPDEPHRLRTNPKGLVMYWLFFRFPDKGVRLLGLPEDESEWLVDELQSFPYRMFDATDRIHHVFQRLFSHYDRLPPDTAQRRLGLRNTLLELLLALVEAKATPSRNSSADKIEPLLREMQKNPGYDYHMDELTKKCALSPSALTLLFKQATGLPPHAYLIKCRIQKSQEMLKNRDQNIVDVSAKLGFCSSQHFAMCFKKETGLTPSEFRKQHI